MPTYNKLVRDRIIEIIEKSGRMPYHTVLDDKGYNSELRIKLQEEMKEYLAAEKTQDSIEELADLLEVIFALAKIHGASAEELMQVQKNKRKDRGGFEQRIFLEKVND